MDGGWGEKGEAGGRREAGGGWGEKSGGRGRKEGGEERGRRESQHTYTHTHTLAHAHYLVLQCKFLSFDVPGLTHSHQRAAMATLYTLRALTEQ